jgi:hypothetical protein
MKRAGEFSPGSHRAGLICLCLLHSILLAASSNARAQEKRPGTADWWSLKPLVSPPVPSVHDEKQQGWARNPIDRFVLAAMLEKGLSPSPPADKRALLRRVTFDLTGLPPTQAELDSFLADDAADAYERAVDRLLASPHQGERWARHWMDVVHFAETHGNDQDRPRPNAWPYRDYLIRSFNQDKHYTRFVQEQIAGDVLFPGDPQAVVALGFLAAGPWDESSLLNINEDTIDKKVARNLDRDDMVTTTMSTFAGATVHCARCHEHKFDPFTQRDYYALQAVFAGVDKAERAFDPDPVVAMRRQELQAKKVHWQSPKAAEDPALLSAELQRQAQDWEKKRSAAASIWTVVDPTSAASAGGATLTKLSDLSLLSGGTRPEKDVYTIVARTDLQRITGVRLEVLLDDSLPHKGPGRQDNGNLHLNEFKVQIAAAGEPDRKLDVPLVNPTADFNQDGWTIAHAIDGKPGTAWGIYPQVGHSHRAVFELKEPAGFAGGSIVTFTLEQTHGGGHLIGRARLSLTTAPHPDASADALPENVVRLLNVAAGKRTDAEKAELALHVLRQQLERELAELPPPQMIYVATNDFNPEGNFKPAKVPRPIHVLTRGDINKPGEEAAPGALSCISGLEARFTVKDPANEGERRAALARWLSDSRNVLVWRSIVNRVWHYHFGKGIVDTPNDLGRMGGKPSHPELLDWLAVTFLESGGSLKQLHRLIVTSAAYRQSSENNEAFAAIDADNRLLWRMNRARLDAESVRDTVLQIAGKLNVTMGGPSVKQFIQTPGIHVTPNVDYLNFDVDRPESNRRSVYRFLFRTLPDPFMESLDCPDFSQAAPVRNSAVTAMQALSMLHNRFMVRMSEHLAQRAADAGTEPAEQVRVAYRLILQRDPNEREGKLLCDFVARHGLANACRMLLNSNEFIFLP